MIIRELIARFGFDVDEKGAKQVDKRIDGMKKGIGSLGKLMGVSLGAAGAKAFFNVGQSVARATTNMKIFSGLSLEKLKSEFKGVQSELDAIKAGAGDIVTRKQFDIAGAGFFKVFGKGEAQLKSFRELFTFSAKQAGITGKKVTDIFEQVQGGITGGGLEAFLDLPNLDIFQKQLKESVLTIIDPNEIGGRIAIENNLKAIMGIVASATEDQNAALKQVPGNLFEMDKATNQVKDSVGKLAEEINTALTPAIEAANTGINKTTEILADIRTRGAKQGVIAAALNNLFPRETTKKPEKPLSEQTMMGQLFRFSSLGGQSSAAGGTTITNTFNISNPDPVKVGQIVDEKIRDSVVNAKRSIVKTEE